MKHKTLESEPFTKEEIVHYIKLYKGLDRDQSPEAQKLSVSVIIGGDFLSGHKYIPKKNP